MARHQGPGALGVGSMGEIPRKATRRVGGRLMMLSVLTTDGYGILQHRYAARPRALVRGRLVGTTARTSASSEPT